MNDIKKFFKDQSLSSHKGIIKEIDLLEKKGNVYASTIKMRIESLRWNSPKIIKKINFDLTNQTFIDVETGTFNGSEPGRLWLIGILHNKRLLQFKLPEEKDQFCDYLKLHSIKSVAAWSDYDRKALQIYYGKALSFLHFFDACSRARRSIIWHTYRLDKLHEAFFGKMELTNTITGLEAGVYADHLIIPRKNCPFCPSKESIEEKIRLKNANDLYQMHEICEVTHSYNHSTS